MAFFAPRTLIRCLKVIRPLGLRMIGYTSGSAPLLVTPKQLDGLIKSPSPVSILDSSWFMPNSPRNSKHEFSQKRIPGAQFLDLDEVASPHELGLKHMMPDGETFAKACETLGVSDSSHVIFYDSQGIFSSPRALFMFRSFGHEKSSVLDGGLPRWSDEGYPVDYFPTNAPKPGLYSVPELKKDAVRSYDYMKSNSEQLLSRNSDPVLDARSRGRFTGGDPEPRPGLKSGHMNHSHSLPFLEFLEKRQTKDGQEYSVFKSITEIREALNGALSSEQTEEIIRGEKHAITTCGSGMTAGVLWLGLRLLQAPHVSLYDESWTGWAMRPSSKIIST